MFNTNLERLKLLLHRLRGQLGGFRPLLQRVQVFDHRVLGGSLFHELFLGVQSLLAQDARVVVQVRIAAGRTDVQIQAARVSVGLLFGLGHVRVVFRLAVALVVS